MEQILDDATAEYFLKSREVLRDRPTPVTLQVFQKREGAVLCGIDKAVDYIKRNALGPVRIKALKDGDIVSAWEPVMHIEADLWHVVALESTYLGMMARATRVATNAHDVVKAANGKPVLFFADRFDVWQTQETDGHAAAVGGVAAVCTKVMAKRTNLQSVGTMPHALIAAFGGDVVQASLAFRETFPGEPITALVDFNNDCVGDSVRALKALGKDLHAVRLDTSEKLMDESVIPFNQAQYLEEEFGVKWFDPDHRKAETHGVNVTLVRLVRKALDENGGQHVKIVVSGGFDVRKIEKFEFYKAPVDIYAVGSSLLKNPIDFTSDVVLPVAKVGRKYRENPRLEVR